MTELMKCEICGGQDFSDFLECTDHFLTKEKFKLAKCNSCGFVFLNPRPDTDKLHLYYDSPDYISHSGSEKGIINKVYKKIRTHTHKKKYNLVKKHSQGKKILDIGCGSGELLNLFKMKGWETLGVEPNENARKFAMLTHKLNVIDENETEKIPDHSFPAIMLWHVLEHVPGLNERMEELKRILQTDGVLFVAIPHCSSYDAEYYKQYWAAYDVPRHLWHFTPKTIELLCEKHKFSVTGVLPMKFDSYYVSLLSEKYKYGKQKLFSGFRRGYMSNIKAGRGHGSYSSQIYIIRNKA
jgi:ubiquinone/menaquinone biosynthesis C-methylase UbiE